jgi:hypothetical protein
MDSNPSLQQAATGNTPSNETSPSVSSPSASATPGGFSPFALELGAAILETVAMGQALDSEMKRIVRIPKARERMTQGFEQLASMHGGLFAMLAAQGAYDRMAFYDACEAHRDASRKELEMQEMAKAAGITVEEFQKKMSELKPSSDVKTP